jgi:hypothetical protein
MKFSQYDAVKIVSFPAGRFPEADVISRRAPRVGDVATIIEIYAKPPGYELECCDGNGITEWLMAFQTDEVELELVK